MRQKLSFSDKLTSPLPWDPSFRAYAAPAAATFNTPELEILQTSVPGAGQRRVRAILRSGRGAPVAGIIVSRARLRSVTIDGRIARPNPRSTAAMTSYRHITLPEHGAELDMTVEGPEPLEVILFDRSELPPPSAPWIASRPTWAVPAHAGDRILVTRRTRI